MLADFLERYILGLRKSEKDNKEHFPEPTEIQHCGLRLATGIPSPSICSGATFIPKVSASTLCLEDFAQLTGWSLLETKGRCEFLLGTWEIGGAASVSPGS